MKWKSNDPDDLISSVSPESDICISVYASGEWARSNSTFAQDKFNASGKLVDENTKKFLQQLLQHLADWTKRLKQ